MRKRWWTTGMVLLLFCAGVTALAQRESPADLDPVKLMPDTHRVLFENTFVRVVESRIPAGGHEIRHWHPHNVTVALGEWDADITTFPDGKTVHVHRSAGTAAWNEAGIHEVRIGAAAPTHTIRIELKY
jgi:hypothetical protein